MVSQREFESLEAQVNDLENQLASVQKALRQKTRPVDIDAIEATIATRMAVAIDAAIVKRMSFAVDPKLKTLEDRLSLALETIDAQADRIAQFEALTDDLRKKVHDYQGKDRYAITQAQVRKVLREENATD